MRVSHLAIALTATGLATTAAITGLEAGPTITKDDPGCEIRASRVSGGVLLEAVAISSRPFSGTYEFRVRNDSHAGSSSTSQSGDFEIGSGTETVLSEVALSDGGKAKADLRLMWPGGETSCER